MEDNRIPYLAALAGLLHDIGKFAHRAGELGTRNWDADAKRDYKYFHALLTGDFIAHYVPEAWRTAIKNTAAGHHRPLSLEDTVLALADHLSAGERADIGDDQRASQPRQLLSIFCSITADEQKSAAELYWPLQQLSIDVNTPKEKVFPAQPLPDGKVWDIYKSLWDDFCHEAAALRDAHQPDGNLPVYLESLLLLMQRYTWCMPSAYYKTRPDVSLYDHARMTGALSAILQDSKLNIDQFKAILQAPDKSQAPVALLVGGDLSGVQDFIYTITARGATSALRGRSFYLQVLTDVIAQFILSELDLPATNLIYNGGANFYLLARPQDAERLVEIQKKISQSLLYHHRGDLYLALAGLTLNSSDFFAGKISHSWEQLGEKLQHAKLQRFIELGSDMAALFQPLGHGGNKDKQCQVCGNEHPGTDIKDGTKTNDNRDGIRVCPPCRSFEALGEDLRKASYILLSEIEPVQAPELTDHPAPGDRQAVLANFGRRLEISEAGSLPEPAAKQRGWLYAINEAAYRKLPTQRSSQVVSGRRFLVNVTPLITREEIDQLREKRIQDLPSPGSTKPFHAMEAQAQGIQRLGVLQMDVDNLGKFFSKGLSEHATLSRVASLSFTISLFFEGWVSVLAERLNQSDKKGHRLYSIYSGGDDLFFVGAWDAVIEFARQVRADLTPFATGHPGIHASAGIALIDGKYPLYQAAQDSHAALEAAKHLQWFSSDDQPKCKDAITFLGETLPWEKFGLADCEQQDIHTAHSLMHLLTEDMDKKKSNPVIRRLLGIYQRYSEAQESRRRVGQDLNRAGQPQALWGPWNWLGFYSLSRLYRQHHDPEVQELRNQLKADDFRSIEWIGLAARWAELFNR